MAFNGREVIQANFRFKGKPYVEDVDDYAKTMTIAKSKAKRMMREVDNLDEVYLRSKAHLDVVWHLERKSGTWHKQTVKKKGD